MESQDEKPIIYTMENKPIVTCKWRAVALSSFSLGLTVSKAARCISCWFELRSPLWLETLPARVAVGVNYDLKMFYNIGTFKRHSCRRFMAQWDVALVASQLACIDQQAPACGTTSRLVAAVLGVQKSRCFSLISPLRPVSDPQRCRTVTWWSPARFAIHKSLGALRKLPGRVILGADPGTGCHFQRFFTLTLRCQTLPPFYSRR